MPSHPVQVVVRCSGPDPDAGTSRTSLRCSPSERRVWVERGEGKERKIVFSSTFDAVLDAGAEAAPFSGLQTGQTGDTRSVQTCIQI